MMKGNGFGDRARLLAEWFQDWNSCEQTIALYSLLSKVSATQARFLSLVLEHSLKNGCDSGELSKLEKQANNAAYLSSLHSQTEAQALTQLLAHLPLLNPGNSEARGEYMKLLPKVMLGSSEELDYLDQCRQLLSLALVHPAFPHEDREALTFWLSQLDRKQKNIVDRKVPSPQRPPIPPRIHQIKSSEDFGRPSSNGSNGSRIYINGDLHVSKQSEGSLGDLDSFTMDLRGGFGEEDEQGPRSTKSLQHNRSLFSPVSGVENSATLPANSYEEMASLSRMDKCNSLPMSKSLSGYMLAVEEGSTVGGLGGQQVDWKKGMKDVPLWLKSLRLHKYQYLFADLTYEQMLQMSEEYLEEKKVTKGARTKIILSIRKLARRPETLTEIEQDMEKHGRLLQCINELRQMLGTPIKPYSPSDETDNKEQLPVKSSTSPEKSRENKTDGGSGDEDEDGYMPNGRSASPNLSPQAQHSSSDGGSDLEELLAKDFPHEDLPSLITRAMGKGYSQLMLHTDTNEDNLGAFIKLVDAALQHEVFTVDQKNMFFDWKQQCTQTLRVISPKKPQRGRNWGPGFYTIHAIPSQTQPPSGRGGGIVNKTRSLRAARNGVTSPGKGLSSLPSAGRSSSTLPRMSARQLQQPLPHHSPTFLRPRSTTITVNPMNPQGTFSLSTTSTSSTSSSSFAPPPPLPPRSCDETYMENLSKRVTDHVLDDLSDS